MGGSQGSTRQRLGTLGLNDGTPLGSGNVMGTTWSDGGGWFSYKLIDEAFGRFGAVRPSDLGRHPNWVFVGSTESNLSVDGAWLFPLRFAPCRNRFPTF